MSEPEPTDKRASAIRGASPFGAMAFLPGLVKLAREMGYAITVHGTLARDFDFVAVPWAPAAASAEDLAEAIRARVGGLFHSEEPEPALRPHGRKCWKIHLGGGPYIDLSIMPTKEQP